MAISNAEKQAKYRKTLKIKAEVEKSKKEAIERAEKAALRREISHLKAENELILSEQKEKDNNMLESLYLRGILELLPKIPENERASVLFDFSFTKTKLQAAAALYYEFFPYAEKHTLQTQFLDKNFDETGKVILKNIVKNWRG